MNRGQIFKVAPWCLLHRDLRRVFSSSVLRSSHHTMSRRREIRARRPRTKVREAEGRGRISWRRLIGGCALDGAGQDAVKHENGATRNAEVSSEARRARVTRKEMNHPQHNLRRA